MEIQQLNVEDFVVKTNIKDIILDEYRTHIKDANASISDEEFTNRLMKYNVKRRDIRQWERSGLKNLKYVDVDQNRYTTIQCPQRSSESTASTSATTLNVDDRNSDRSGSNIFEHIRKSTSAEPSQFQKEIMAMSFEAFVNETNVKELVRKSFEDRTEQLTEATMEVELKKLDEQRYHFRRYRKGVLHHLKMLKCECRRHKQFEEKSTQTDPIESQDAVVQSHSVKSGSNEATESLHNEHAHDNSSCQSKLGLLSVHEITESEIIQIKSVSPTGIEGKRKSETRTVHFKFGNLIKCFVSQNIK